MIGNFLRKSGFPFYRLCRQLCKQTLSIGVSAFEVSQRAPKFEAFRLVKFAIFENVT